MLTLRAKPNITTERLMASLTLDRFALGLALTGCAGLTHAAGTPLGGGVAGQADIPGAQFTHGF